MNDMMELKRDEGPLVTALERAGGEVGSTVVKCPFCGGESGADSIHTNARGVYIFLCPGCRWYGDVLDVEAWRLGVPVADVVERYRQAQQGPPLNDLTATHTERRGDIAERYGQRGWAVFPVDLGWNAAKGEKVAIPHVPWKESASSDADTIRGWWRQWPTASIAIDCGKSGLWVLDVDVHGCDGYESLKQLFAGHEADLKTLTARTPSGGMHLYYQAPAGVEIRNSAGLLGPGLDTRGAGGCIFAPGSEYAGKPYTWQDKGAEVLPMPGWLIDRLRKPERIPAPVLPFAGLPEIPDTRKRAYIESAVKSAVAAVSHAPEGTRNETLNEQCFSLATINDLSDDAIWAAMRGAAMAAGLEEAETTATLRSAITKGRLKPRDLAADMRRTERPPQVGGATPVEIVADEDEPVDPPRGWQPFPVDLLPDTLAEFVTDAARALVVNPAMLALPCLSLCAGAVGNTAKVRLKDSWYEPLVLWTVVVCEPSSGKTPAFRAAKAPADRIQGDAARQWKTEYEKRKSEAKKNETIVMPPFMRPLIGDATIEAVAEALSFNERGLCLCNDELSEWFDSFDRYSGNKSSKGGGNCSKWLSMWNAGSITVDRKTGVKHVHVPHAAMSLTGGIQPGALRRYMDGAMIERGMFARMMVAYPPQQPKPWSDAVIDPQIAARYERLYQNLYALPYSDWPITLELDAEAKQYNPELHNRADEERLAHSGAAADLWGKIPGHGARLAGLFALIEHLETGNVAVNVPGEDDGTTEAFSDAIRKINGQTLAITLEQLHRGFTLAEWFGHEGLRVLATFREDDLVRDDRLLLDFIRARYRDGITPRELSQARRSCRPTSKARNTLERLAKDGHGVMKGDLFVIVSTCQQVA